ncbi:MAG TPA: hypothetical protein VF580_03505, partial [Thermoanaerobaculia bacterium]
MTAATVLPFILVFPILGFLINGFLYLASHSKLGGKDAPLGPHGHGGHGDGSGDTPAAHADAAHGGRDAQGGHDSHGDHHDIPFKAVHTWVG